MQVMKVIIRYPKKKEFEFPGSRRVQDVLKELHMNPESVVVVRGGTLLTKDVVVKDDEVVEVLNAISGGG